jgi:positive regulator of sigma E activity
MFGFLETMLYLVALLLYLAPAIVADMRAREDALAITIVNVLLGWTVVGWIAAFVWARHPVSERHLSRVAKSTRRAMAKVTIGALVARSRRRRVA